MDLCTSICDDTVSTSIGERQQLYELDEIIPKLSETLEKFTDDINTMMRFKTQCERLVVKLNFFKMNNIIPAEETIVECRTVIHAILNCDLKDYLRNLIVLIRDLIDKGEWDFD